MSDSAAVTRAVGVSTRTLERRFLEETGLTFGRWRRQATLLEGLRQLAAGHSVKSVSSTCGYAEPSAFVAAFKALYGQTPGRYFSGTGGACYRSERSASVAAARCASEIVESLKKRWYAARAASTLPCAFSSSAKFRSSTGRVSCDLSSNA